MPKCLIDGETIHYERYGAPDSHALLFIHGAGGSAEIWKACVPYLTQFNCILIDLPGHYRSDGTAKNSIADYAFFVEELISELALDSGKLCLVGHSMGGAIGIEIACREKPPIDQLVLVATGSKLKVNEQFLAQLAQGVYDLSFVELGFGSGTAKELINRIIEQRSFVTSESRYLDFLACNAFDRRNDLSLIQIPALIVAGEEDRMTPPAYSVYMHERIHNSKIVFATAGHHLPVERPEQLADAITLFLDRI